MSVATVTAAPVLAHLRAAFPATEDWIELPGCPVCGRSDTVEDVGAVDGRGPGLVTAVCLDCEHAFIRRRPRKGWLDEYYAREWDQGGRESTRKRVRPDYKVADFASAALRPDSKVLDVGAGFGKGLLGFRERGHRVQGLERSEHRARHVRDVLGIACESHPLEAFDSAERFDLVYMNHVLEHVDDPAEAITHARALLVGDALLYVAVPNLWAEHAPQAFHFVPHLSSFTLRSLRRLLERRGFEVIAAEEGNELQMLARSTDASSGGELPRSDPGARGAFWRRVEDWVARGFAGHSADRVLAWHPAEHEKHTYDSHVVASGRLRYGLMRGAHRARSSALGARLLDGRLPGYLRNERLRMLPVRASDEPGLPLRVVHPSGSPPVWVK